MSTPRFLVPDPSQGHGANAAIGLTVALPKAAAHHARRVLRLRPLDAVILFDGRGNEYLAAVLPESSEAAAVLVRISAGGAVDREALVPITLVQVLSAQDKIDWLIEKCVELGVARIVFAAAERSVVRLDEARGQRRLERWREIAAAACAQCGRNRVPAIELERDLASALRGAPADASRWLLDPHAALGLGSALANVPGATRQVFVVGPEGGFAPSEHALAVTLGFAPVRLGARVLRTETAGLAAVTALLALLGEYR